MNALLSRLSLSAEIVVDLLEDESHHPLLNTVRLGAVDIAPVEVVFNERRFSYLDYSHHVSFTELVIISPRSDLCHCPRTEF